MSDNDELDAFGYRAPQRGVSPVAVECTDGKTAETLEPLVVTWFREYVGQPDAERLVVVLPPDDAERLAALLFEMAATARAKHWA